MLRILLAAPLFLLGNFSRAQTYIEDVLLLAQGVGVHEEPLDSVWRQYLLIRVSDTLWIENVHIEIGESENSSEFLSEVIDYNGPNSFSSPMAFERNGIFMKFILGDDVIDQPYFYRVSLEDANETLFSTFTINR